MSQYSLEVRQEGTELVTNAWGTKRMGWHRLDFGVSTLDGALFLGEGGY